MNERIKELAIQAGFGPKWTTDSNPGEPSNINAVLLKEFAELIINECVDYTWQTGTERHAAHLKEMREHFGVE